MKKRILSFLLVVTMAFSVMSVSVFAKATGTEETVNPESAIASNDAEANDQEFEQMIKAGITTSLGEIPYIGSELSSMSVPYLSKWLGLKSDTDAIKEEIQKVRDDIQKLSGLVDSSTQSILKEMYKTKNFSDFENTYNGLMSPLQRIYAWIDTYTLQEGVSDEFRTLQTAELLTGKEFNVDDLANRAAYLLTYLNGDRETFENDGNILQNGYYAKCLDSKLGGEAALASSKFLGKAVNAVNAAYGAILTVLYAKQYVYEHYNDYEKLAETDSKINAAFTENTRKQYLSPFTDIIDIECARYEAFFLTKAQIESRNQQRGKSLPFAGSEYSAYSLEKYRAFVKENWFNFIRNARIENGRVVVEYVPLNPTLGRLISNENRENELGFKNFSSFDYESAVYMLADVENKTKKKLQANGLSKDEIEAIISHFVENPNNVFLPAHDATSGTVEYSLMDTMTAYGFNIPNSKGYNPWFARDINFEQDVLITYHLRMNAQKSEKIKYNAETGIPESSLPGWEDNHVYYYYIHISSHPSERRENNRTDVFYYFKNAEEHFHFDDLSDKEMQFSPWTSDNSLPITAGNYYLTKDVTLPDTWRIPKDRDEINLCLNGHVIKTAAGQRCISVGTSTTLNIHDCNGDSCTHDGYVDSDGLWHLGSGSGTAKTITGGLITGSANHGVYIFSYGHFNMYGGTIAGNEANFGGGVYNDGVFNMYGGEICYNITSENSGGGVFSNSAYTSMYGGTISHNTAGYCGGGVHISSGKAFNMYGGTVSDNKAEYGGGVCVYSGTLNMNGGTVSDNTANYGGGVYARSGNIVLGGSSIIDNNAVNNLYIKNGFLVDVGTGDNAPTEDMKIGVTLGSGTGAFTNKCADYSANFTADKSSLGVFYEDGVLMLAKAQRHIIGGNVISFREWKSENSLPITAGNYYLTKDVILPDTWGVPKDRGVINLCLNGHVIKTAAGQRCISVGSRTTLNIHDCNGDRCTHAGYVDSDGLWHLGSGSGTAKTITGGLITGSANSGVYIYAYGHLNMYGGTIAGNEAKYGGGVYNDGVFNMYGGEICYNITSENSGGGVFSNSAYTNMYGGTISHNTAGYCGGGVHITNDKAFNMHGGTISNNKGEYGGGVCVYSGTLNMNGGTVSDNTANYGGGVYARSGSVVLGGSSIIDNNAVNNLYIKNGFLIDIGTGDNAPTEDMKIGVTLGSGTGAFTKSCSNYSAYFTSDNSAYRVAYNGTGKYLELKSGDSESEHTIHKAVLQKGTAPKLFTAGCKDYYKCSCGKYYEDEARTVEIKDLDSWKAKGGNGYVAPTIGEKCDECGVWHTNGLLGDIFCWMVKLIKLVVDFVHNIFKITI